MATASQTDLEILASFHHGVRRLLAIADDELQRHGLGPRRYYAMLAIQAHWTGTEITVGELSELLLIRHNSAVGLVKRLERDGFVQKWSDPSNRSRVLLRLTERGMAVLSEIAAVQLPRLRRNRPALLELFGALKS